MKINIDLTNNLNYENISFPKSVPVLFHGKEVGECLIDTDGKLEITVKKEHNKLQIINSMGLGIGGHITSREGNIITGINVKEISII